MGRGREIRPSPPRVSRLSAVELSGKEKQRIPLDDYLRLVVRFVILGQHVTQLREVKGQTFAKSTLFNYTLCYLKKYKL